jgi:hypothetical protein
LRRLTQLPFLVRQLLRISFKSFLVSSATSSSGLSLKIFKIKIVLLLSSNTNDPPKINNALLKEASKDVR